MKAFIIIISSILFTSNVLAQTNYYPLDSAVIYKEGYSYKYVPFMFSKNLYNVNAIYFNKVEFARRDGQEFSIDEKEPFSSHHNPIGGANFPVEHIDSVIISKFPENQLPYLAESTVDLLIILTINTTNGKVADVVFDIDNNSNFMYIPVEIYRSIELELKRLLVFELTEYASELNYASISWFVDFNEDTE